MSKLKSIFSSLFFVIIFIYYEFLFKQFGSIPLGNTTLLLLYTIAAGLLVHTIYIFLARTKILRLIFAELVLIITAVYFITECFVGNVFQTFMTPSALLAGASDVTTGFSNEIALTISSGWYLILLYLIPAFVIFFFLKKSAPCKKCRIGTQAFDQCFCTFVTLFVCTIGCLTLGSYFGQQEPSFSSEYQFDASMRKNGVFATCVAQITYGNSSGDFIIDESEISEAVSEDISIEETTEIPEEEVIVYEPNTMDIDFNTLASTASNEAVANLDKFLAAQSGAMQNEYTGLFEGKNLILITAEAFSHYAVDETLTPTLYRMMHNGFYFSDYYQPAWGGSTSTGEYSILTGLVPTNGVQSMKDTADHNLYLTIGNQLSRLGYFTAAYHNNSYTYYNRNTTHTNFGYSTFTGMGNGMEAGVTNSWPESDLEMVNFTVSQYIDQQPFSIYYMTVSGHCAYSQGGNDMSAKNWEAVQTLPYSDTIKAYYAAQLELEYAMASLIEQLETAGILDDTVICLSSDHYPYGLEAGETWGNYQNYMPELYGVEESALNKFVQDQNALIIWSGSLENDLKDYAVEISEPTYSLDILPTLSNLFGVEYDSRMLVGRDVFSDEEALVIWPDYSWKTSTATYMASNGSVTAAGDEVVSEEYVQRIKTLVANKITLSKTTLDYDYWGHVFGSGE